MVTPIAAICAWMNSPIARRAVVVLNVKTGLPPEALYSSMSAFALAGS